ncbi:leucyl/phenylalanyl-tRNA--protein transferase [Aliidiomarina iranensis]|uniref:Leucyl/phenylalanyl-tRNA--protein transferase n=1 Tax=Aliidiomarina iranensis TaxID=1434071 RepID=A0A432W095_9GAMM|nr:leucyl/phenylalanyl-tRNA--protein transferase [Aliidiomarina iranensis]RUO22449.1 leucyl/phenylalanyl-tRNA--protein transferase [Aliidiomarina iranensis]
MSYLLDLEGTPKDFSFPDTSLALKDPDGLLAVGGCLSVERLYNAYKNGIFPWYSEDDPILWWSPSERAVIFPDDLYVNRSLRKFFRKNPYRVTLNSAFQRVIQACAYIPRGPGNGTWITEEMISAYVALHHAGYAHSIEIWQDEALVGGLYGVLIGQIFCGESMFSAEPNASKLALVALRNHFQPAGLTLIDCQLENQHLINMGAISITREAFIKKLKLSQSPIAKKFLQATELNPLDVGN